MAKYKLDGVVPNVDSSAWIADSAQVIGSVNMAADSSVWFGAVLRGDNDPINVGEGSNIQDGSVLHTDKGKPLHIGKHVTIGHNVILHGCSIGDESLIGMGAIVLNGAKIGRHCLVGAGALVTENKVFPDGSLIVGNPAKVVRALTDEQIAGLKRSAEGYMTNAKRFKNGLRKLAD